MFNIIFTMFNIQNALVNSLIKEVKMLPLDTVVSFKANQWLDCLSRIQTLCSTKWIKKKDHKIRGLVFGETRLCHHAGEYTLDWSVCLAQKDSKHCNYAVILYIKQYVDNPNVVDFCMKKDHTNHVPGESSNIRTLPLTSETVKMIENQLRGGSNFRNTRISVLRQIEEWGTGVRKLNYEDVYNRMRKVFTIKNVSTSEPKKCMREIMACIQHATAPQ
ncbi:hypothetical protein PHYBLDRAFT_66617 [Phycomyces blakesleeanus NRRL 1555(-)]|uniref:Uncharacterized protein n=1 Tax=Phycomyces blakesleeanus (strain ATCC 8743b / DSM 1359 / FGSC 10004 / NBRC 33097 / NRRL 1555) TaxID=763407 RepID=A0A167L253_PHYB8|nr:hypothetical protein PHYBLDRAFT_66617 [Phycomyces blakesleeanus NRRL 1555(-)]OAD69419.1 hypothetical protein PHYBLDRAFT_66617 [Phycomyces blakesleeanus NRRL 1555(-)]|eukprot:XP_018287459.1 hypothetical protein PHYBLDRAFT_66617 [Phycomyces blakesleeanus NRRL 1555(-)]